MGNEASSHLCRLFKRAACKLPRLVCRAPASVMDHYDDQDDGAILVYRSSSPRLQTEIRRGGRPTALGGRRFTEGVAVNSRVPRPIPGRPVVLGACFEIRFFQNPHLLRDRGSEIRSPKGLAACEPGSRALGMSPVCTYRPPLSLQSHQCRSALLVRRMTRRVHGISGRSRQSLYG